MISVTGQIIISVVVLLILTLLGLVVWFYLKDEEISTARYVEERNNRNPNANANANGQAVNGANGANGDRL
jgi:flagellar basal body-associated protein FliL